jgi:uncharacterized membrane protein
MTTIAASAAALLPPPVARRRAARVGLAVLQGLLAAIFLFSASGKLSLDPTVVAGFSAMGFSTTGTVIIGVLELLGAVGLLVPRLSGIASWALVGLMVGATLATVLTVGGAMVAVPAVTLVLVATVAWVRRHEVAALAREVRGLVG